MPSGYITLMIRLPPDLPDRFLAANEVHARPYEPLDIPVRGSYLAIQVETGQRELERAHLRVLCERFGCSPPPPLPPLPAAATVVARGRASGLAHAELLLAQSRAS